MLPALRKESLSTTCLVASPTMKQPASSITLKLRTGSLKALSTDSEFLKVTINATMSSALSTSKEELQKHSPLVTSNHPLAINSTATVPPKPMSKAICQLSTPRLHPMEVLSATWSSSSKPVSLLLRKSSWFVLSLLSSESITPKCQHGTAIIVQNY